jgi:hypothetical protein
MAKSRQRSFIRIQIQSKPQNHAPYCPKKLESALKSLGLPEIPRNFPWEATDREGVIRHETGPEIVALATSLVSLATAIVGLVSLWKKERPETKISITVNSEDELERVLNVLNPK